MGGGWGSTSCIENRQVVRGVGYGGFCGLAKAAGGGKRFFLLLFVSRFVPEWWV